MHDTDMRIPISNSIYGVKKNSFLTKKIRPAYLNNLKFFEVDKKKYPSIKLLEKYKKNPKILPIVINAANEELVSLFLKNKIKFTDIVKYINKILNHKDFKKIVKKNPKTLDDIYKYDKWARLKTKTISVE